MVSPKSDKGNIWDDQFTKRLLHLAAVRTWINVIPQDNYPGGIAPRMV
jgi:hypothetical protein